MLSSKSGLLAMAFSLLLPCYVNAQESSPSKNPSQPESQLGGTQQQGSAATQQRESQATHKQDFQREQPATSLKTDSDRAQQSKGSVKGDQALISVQSIANSKVLDSDNKELGSVKHILIDPEDGRLVRADIALGGGGIMGAPGFGRYRHVPLAFPPSHHPIANQACPKTALEIVLTPPK